MVRLVAFLEQVDVSDIDGEHWTRAQRLRWALAVAAIIFAILAIVAMVLAVVANRATEAANRATAAAAEEADRRRLEAEELALADLSQASVDPAGVGG